jgi:hypothetical protein
MKNLIRRLFCKHHYTREVYHSRPYLGPLNYMALVHKNHLEDVIKYRIDERYKVCTLCSKKVAQISRTKFKVFN